MMFDNHGRLVEDYRELGYMGADLLPSCEAKIGDGYYPISHLASLDFAPVNACVPLREIEEAFADRIYTPKRILRSGPATIVFWQDGTKTIVKLSEGEEDNAYSAFTAALAIKIFGSNSKLKKMVKTKTEEQK